MKKLIPLAVTLCMTLSNLQLVAAELCYSWIDQPYVKGSSPVSYQVESEFRASHKVQRWKLKDGTWTKDDETDVTATAASHSGGFYWQAMFQSSCRLLNYSGTGKDKALIKTRFQSPQQANNGANYIAQMGPSGTKKLQKYTLPGTAKDGEALEKDNKATAAKAVTVTD